MSRELADHLKYFEEIGVTAVSRDPKWRKREMVPGTVEIAATVPGTLAESLDDIKIEIGALCMRCKLCNLGRSQTVFGVATLKRCAK